MSAIPIYQSTIPVTVAASPSYSPWVLASNASQVRASWTSTGGSTAVSAQWSFDGQNVSSEVPDTVLTTGTAAAVLAPWVRFKVAQSAGDMTAFAIFGQELA